MWPIVCPRCEITTAPQKEAGVVDSCSGTGETGAVALRCKGPLCRQRRHSLAGSRWSWTSHHRRAPSGCGRKRNSFHPGHIKGLATHSRSGKTGNLTHVQSYWQSHQESKLADQAPYLSQSKVGGQRLNLLLTLCRRNPGAAAPSDNGHSGRVGFQSRQPGPACGITGLSKLSRPGRL